MTDFTEIIRQSLIHHDPMGIVFEDAENFDEYDGEIPAIATAAKDSDSPQTFLSQVHAVFVKAFGEIEAGPADRYEPVAQEIWRNTHYDKMS